MKRIVYILPLLLLFCLLSACEGGCKHPTEKARVEEYTAASCSQEGYYYSVAECNECGAEVSRERIAVPRVSHTADGHICTVCGEVLESSEGLALTPTADGTGYVLTGLGTCTDEDVYIGYHDGKPIVTIDQKALLPDGADYNETTKRVYIGECVGEIHENALYGSYMYALESITVSAANKSYSSVDGALYTKDGATLLTYPRANPASVYSAPESLKAVERSAFYGALFTEVVLHDGVTTLSEYSFSACESLTRVTLGNSITVIPNYCFFACSSLSEITLPCSLTEIGEKAFRSCRSLTKIVIPKSVTVIRTHAFAQCTELTVYCEAESAPEGFEYRWDYNVKAVTWAYTSENK